MRYNAKIPIEAKKAVAYLKKLIRAGKRFKIEEIHNKRTIPQNKFFHFLVTAFAVEYGDYREYIKQHYIKRVICPDIFIRINISKTGKYLRSTADLDRKEMREVIDRFRTWSDREAGIYLPEANEKGAWEHYELLAEKYKYMVRGL